ncbi:hypothetical protein [Allorhodopirellula heiligendammensis]|uniref:Uncharacterized protein n=1 Tax=Allorhodopirellula heiligendammensis TaxID=2714739 RepID=A0A5C6C3V8_9BACT|nr:hypothetical protein [Allorhodopirellula heiligendammensis]TWU17984.1 hypothetical protein Poly21_01370 [Allorhodopirellula heiligendammensis]
MSSPYSSTGAVEAFESWDSRSVKLSTAEGGDGKTIKAYITGTTDEAAAYAALLAELSPVLDLVGIGQSVIAEGIAMNPIGNGIWEASVEYVNPKDKKSENQPKAVGECTFAFDGTGGTTTTLYGFSQERFPPTAVDFGTAIEIGEDGRPKGVEIVIPQVKFTLQQSFEGATITLPWLRSLIYLTGTTNIASFLGFAPGEVLFLGPTGQQPLKFMSDATVVAGERDITFQFAVSPNLTGLTIGDIEDIEKGGHDYLWVTSKQVKVSGVIKDVPTGVYVNKVYRPGNFATLGVNDPDTSGPVIGS